MRDETHHNNAKWWTNESGKPIERNKGELLMLVITELAEACDGIRKNLRDDKILTRSMEEVEMADTLIRLMDYAGGFELAILDWRDISPLDNQLSLCKRARQKSLPKSCPWRAW